MSPGYCHPHIDMGQKAEEQSCGRSAQLRSAVSWAPLCSISNKLLAAVLHWSDAGAASWYDVAIAVGELAQELGLLEQPAVVNPLTTAEYPLPAQRPSYSLLECSATRQALDLPALHWRQALRQLLEAVA
jgi:dTDP-4-dehydrorhamnose reductase